MYNPVNLLEAVADVSNLLEAKRLLFESGLLTEAELKDLSGLDKSLDYLDKEVDKALKYSQNLEKIFNAIVPKEIDIAQYKSLLPKIKRDIETAKTDVVKKLKELPKALKSIAQRDFSSSITKRIPIGSDIADAGRAIGDFFGKDSTEGYMLSQVESIAQELTELNSLLKAIISTIARALKYSKGSDEILKIEDESLFNIFLSGKTTGEDEDQTKGQKLVKGIGKELKKRAKMGLKKDLSIALRNLNPFAKTDDLFGLERSDIISLWFSMSPAQFMKLGPALLKPLNKGTVEIGKAAAAVQKDEEEVRKETGAPSSSTSSETKKESLPSAEDAVKTPETYANALKAAKERAAFGVDSQHGTANTAKAYKVLNEKKFSNFRDNAAKGLDQKVLESQAFQNFFYERYELIREMSEIAGEIPMLKGNAEPSEENTKKIKELDEKLEKLVQKVEEMEKNLERDFDSVKLAAKFEGMTDEDIRRKVQATLDSVKPPLKKATEKIKEKPKADSYANANFKAIVAADLEGSFESQMTDVAKQTDARAELEKQAKQEDKVRIKAFNDAIKKMSELRNNDNLMFKKYSKNSNISINNISKHPLVARAYVQYLDAMEKAVAQAAAPDLASPENISKAVTELDVKANVLKDIWEKANKEASDTTIGIELPAIPENTPTNELIQAAEEISDNPKKDIEELPMFKDFFGNQKVSTEEAGKAIKNELEDVANDKTISPEERKKAEDLFRKLQDKVTTESKWLSNDQLLKSLKYSLKPILEEDISYSLLRLMPIEKKVQKPKVIVERQEKKKDILLERWQKLAGLE